MELPKRKPNRLAEYDYGSIGAYFLTICTEHRKSILSSVEGVGEGFPLPKLTSYGEIAERYIYLLSMRYPMATIDAYVIMPNHIHLLLTLGGRRNASPTVTTMMGWMKYQMTKDINSLRNTPGEKVFQRSFYDHVIRDEEDYRIRLQYIKENPLRWERDELYAE